MRAYRFIVALLIVLMTVIAPAHAAFQISKAVTNISDPINSILLPKAIPGAIQEYTITISNPGNFLTTPVVSGITIIDAVPPSTELFVGDMGILTPGPVAFFGLLSGTLSYSFTSLGSSADNIDFSNDGGASWAYTPTGTYDPNVTHIRIRPSNTLLGGGSATFRFRVRVK